MSTVSVETFSEIAVIYRSSFADVCKVNARIRQDEQGPSTVCDRLCTARFVKLSAQCTEAELRQFLAQNIGLRSLRHDNLVNILDIQIQFDKNTIAFFMDLFEGRNIKKCIEDSGALSETDIKNISRQICSGLAYLHENKIIHRNINSETVVIDENKLVRLVDFGLSIKLLDATSYHSHSRGHPQYMAPEVFLDENLDQPDGGSVYSQGSDIWAFGCVVYEMAVGKKLYEDCRNMLAIVKKVKEKRPPVLPANCSDDLKSFYAGCMVAERHERTRAAGLLEHRFLRRS